MAKSWSYEEEVLALALYCQVPFGMIYANNPEIKALAKSLGRSDASVSMKMCNFARFDPILQARGISGLKNGSKLDEQVWNEFHESMEALADASELAAQKLHINSIIPPEVETLLPEGSTYEHMVSVRRNQMFFRNAVLSAYDQTCCITGLPIRNLLIASHIKPWKDSDPVTERTNPQNGLCLNALHDQAFDRGLITVTPDYRIVISKSVRDMYSSEIVSEWFKRYDGKTITLPSRFAPLREFLEYHNDNVFKE